MVKKELSSAQQTSSVRWRNVLMDAAKLKSLFNGPLGDALAVASTSNTEDPVEFIGKFLVDWSAAQFKLKREAKLAAGAEAELTAVAAAAALNAAAQAEADAADAALTAEDDALLAELSSSVAHESFMSTVLAHAHKRSGATSAYLATYTKTGEGGGDEDGVRYTHCAGSGADVVGLELPAGTGVTRRAWTTVDALSEDCPAWAGFVTRPTAPVENEDGDDANNEEGEDAEGEASEAPYTPGPPDFVAVDNVIRDATVTFLRDAPKLGGFIVVPVSYRSSLHVDAPIDVPDLEDPEPAENEEAEGETEEGAEVAAAAEEEEQEVDAEVDAVPEDMEDFTIERAYVLAADKMGQGTAFTAAQCAELVRWGKALGASLHRAERTLWESEVLARRAARKANRARLAAWLAENDAADAKLERTMAKLAGEEVEDEEGEEEGDEAAADVDEAAEPLSDEELEAKEKELRFDLAKARIGTEQERDTIARLAALRLALLAAPTTLMLCAAQTLELGRWAPNAVPTPVPAEGAAAEEAPDADAQIAADWKALQPALENGAFFAALDGFDPAAMTLHAEAAAAAAAGAEDAESGAAVGGGGGAAALRALVAGLDAEALQEDCVAYAALLMWLEHAHNALEDAEVALAAQRATEAAEAEEAAAAAAEAAAAEADGEGDGEEEDE